MDDFGKEDCSRSQTGTVPGTLQNISTYSRETSRDGNRFTPIVTTKNNPSGSLEALTPDLPFNDNQEYNLNLALEDYETDSDLNSEDCWGEDSQREKLTDCNKNPNTYHTDVKAGKEVVPFHINDNGIDVDSDEERDIMKEIRSEIENQVRADMKGELEIYEKKLQNLEREAAGETTSKETQQDEKEMDPKLKAAILKMRKLDRILSKKVQREKEVKRERFFLQKRLREELAQIKPEGRDDSREIKANMEKFLMLALPPSHNEGVDVDMEEEPPVTPVFHTQLNENEFEDRRNEQQHRNNPSVSSSATSSRTVNSEQNINDDDKLKKKQSKKRSKDFIKRNKQLASDADNPMPMTDDEKKRINDLLGDLEGLPELVEDLESPASNAWISENPFQLNVHSGDGYRPEREQKSSLDRIDSQLKYLLPPEEVISLRSSSYSPDRQRLLSTRATVTDGSDIEFDRLGEKALQEKRDERDLQTRLRNIEEELSRFQSLGEEDESVTPCLSEDALHTLIDQCVYSLSRTSLYTPREDHDTPQSECSSSRLSVLENPPRLDEEVLQKLLAEARGSVLSSRLTAERGGINDVRNHHFTKELGIEPITSETWNVILSHESDQETFVFDNGSVEMTPQPRLSNYHGNTASMSHSIEESLQQFRSDTPLSVQSFRDSENYDAQSYRSSSSRQSRTPFLPEISHSPCLVSQGLQNNIVRPYESTERLESNTVRPYESTERLESNTVRPYESTERLESNRDQKTANRTNSIPRPPTSERPQDIARSRTVTSPPN